MTKMYSCTCCTVKSGHHCMLAIVFGCLPAGLEPHCTLHSCLAHQRTLSQLLCLHRSQRLLHAKHARLISRSWQHLRSSVADAAASALRRTTFSVYQAIQSLYMCPAFRLQCQILFKTTQCMSLTCTSPHAMQSVGRRKLTSASNHGPYSALWIQNGQLQ